MIQTDKVVMADGFAVPVWVLKKACELSGYTMNSPAAYKHHYDYQPPFRALCKLIEETQEPPMCPIEAAAREGCARVSEKEDCVIEAQRFSSGYFTVGGSVTLQRAMAAIEVYIENQEKGKTL